MSDKYAFPDPGRAQSEKQREKLTEMGLTMRDYFAAKAMQAFLQNIPAGRISTNEIESVAKVSFMTADAMMKAREE